MYEDYLRECPMCGESLESDEFYCPECGSKVDGGDEGYFEDPEL